MRTTAAGQVLFDRARSVLREVEHLSAELSDYASGVVGVVRLWTNTSALTQFLPGELAAFQAGHPGIRFELEEQNSSDVVLAVLDGRADLGIFADRTAAHGLDLLNYRRDRLVLDLQSMHLRRIVPNDAWVHRQLLIGVRDVDAMPRQVRLLIDHLCSGQG